MYIRKYCVKDDAGLEAFLKDKEKADRKAKSLARDANYKITPGSSDEEKSRMKKDKRTAEKQDNQAVQDGIRDEVYRRVKNGFYKFENQGWMNPFSRNLADTMFWM
jgi:hypothetical protein